MTWREQRYDHDQALVCESESMAGDPLADNQGPRTIGTNAPLLGVGSMRGAENALHPPSLARGRVVCPVLCALTQPLYESALVSMLRNSYSEHSALRDLRNRHAQRVCFARGVPLE